MPRVVVEQLETDQLRQIVAYWSDLKQTGLGPGWDAFDLMELPPKRVPCTIVADVVDCARGLLTYRFVGTEFQRMHGFDATGMCPLDLPPLEFGRQVDAELRQVCEMGEPLYLMHKHEGATGTGVIQQVVRLPLFGSGGEVSHITSTVEFIEDNKALETYLSGGGAT